MLKKVPILNGGESFADIIRSGAYYVDKTAYLKSLFQTASVQNVLFTRPRRFGKTLNLSMIREFCELNYQSPGDKTRQQKIFLDSGRNLAVAGDEYQTLRDAVMGEFPVVSVSFKGIEGSTFADALSAMVVMVGKLYDDFGFLHASKRLSRSVLKSFAADYDFCITKGKKVGRPLYQQEAKRICCNFLQDLGVMLYREYGREVVILIDEYDVPLQKAVAAERPYYAEILEIIRQLSVSTFKQVRDPWLYRGIVTGCLRIAHQSVFTDANNFTAYGMNLEPYTGFFGFTPDETLKLLHDCGLEDREAEVRAWYDGYRFGTREIFCPWSLMSFCNDAQDNPGMGGVAYWSNSSGNDIVALFAQNSMQAHNAENISRLQQLLDGESVSIELREFSTYPDIRNKVSFDAFMTMMLHTGYVTFADTPDLHESRVSVRIPNHEVLRCFQSKFAYLYSEENPFWYDQGSKLANLLISGSADEIQKLISAMLKEFMSIRNSGSELYYHGFMTGVLGFACAAAGIEFTDETESGDGYPDIVLKKDSADTVTILEFKKGENSRLSRIKAAEDAAAQILEKQYAEPYLTQRYSRVLAVGIGFGGKDCAVRSLGNLAEQNACVRAVRTKD